MKFHFGTFTFDDGTLELARDGRRVALEPQPARALAVLLSRAGTVVTRDELRQAIWGADTHVDYERGLAYCIGQVRSALGDSADHPRYLQTLPRRGFRFVAPVARLADSPAGAVVASERPAAVGAPSPAGAGTPAAAVSGRRLTTPLALAAALTLAVAVALAGVWARQGTTRQDVVAVSIFDNETGEAAHDRFVAGLSDVVVTELTALAPDRVGVVGNLEPLRRPRAIRNLKLLAETLEADYVVIGQLQRQGEDLRFILHFIRLADGVHLSARRFIRPPGEVLVFEPDVVAEARRVVRQFVLERAVPSPRSATR